MSTIHDPTPASPARPPCPTPLGPFYLQNSTKTCPPPPPPPTMLNRLSERATAQHRLSTACSNAPVKCPTMIMELLEHVSSLLAMHQTQLACAGVAKSPAVKLYISHVASSIADCHQPFVLRCRFLLACFWLIRIDCR